MPSYNPGMGPGQGAPSGSAFQFYRAALNNVGSYQVAGIPFLTGSTLSSSQFGTNNAEFPVTFPYVPKSILFVNKGTVPVRIHFASVASGAIANKHYFTLTNNADSVTMNVKCKQVFVSLETSSSNGSFEMFAELTNISSHDMYRLTGLGIDTP